MGSRLRWRGLLVGVALIAVGCAAPVPAAPPIPSASSAPIPQARAAAAPSVPAVGPQAGDVALPAPVSGALATLQQRYVASADALDPGAGFPRRVPAGATAWETEPADDWTGGFFAGTLWETYRLTGDAAWRARAERWTAPLAGQATRTDTHDLGFVIGDSFGDQQRLTGDRGAAGTELTAARSLATRYSPTVHMIKSWDVEGEPDKRGTWRYPVIVDNLMNLDMLYRAAALPGGDPRWAAIATDHARTAATTNQRPDGSTAHVALFDPDTGAFLGRETWQGLSPTSTWARGQGWAIHGFTASARSSGDPALRAAAVRAADWWLAHVPADGVPAWDFDVPGQDRDTSAAAVAASGLLDLASLTGDMRYRQAAQTTLTTLAMRDVAPTGPALLAHTVGGKPQNTEIDVGMTYTDYYFAEAARRWVRGG